MHRIDTTTTAAVIPAAGPVGTPGFFQDQVPGVTPATNFNAEWCNAIQEELFAFLTAAGIAPVKGTHNQVLTSVYALLAVGQCQFSFVSGVLVQLLPYGGNLIKVNGVLVPLPAAGITAANAGVFVNGVAGQNLAANTVYFVYVFMNAGVPTLGFRTGAGASHMLDTTAGNIGVRVRNNGGAPESTHTLVGQVVTNGAGQFQYSTTGTGTAIGVISWFNRRNLSSNSTTAVDQTTVSTTQGAVPGYSVVFVTWADESVLVTATANMSNNTAGDGVVISSNIDGVTTGGINLAQTTSISANQVWTGTSTFASSAAEGASHTATMNFAALNGGTAKIGANISSLSVVVRG